MYTCVVQIFMDKTIDSPAEHPTYSNIIQPSAADSFGHTDTQTQREALHITIIIYRIYHQSPESRSRNTIGAALQIHRKFPPVFPNTVSDSNCSRHCPIDRKSESPSCWRLVQVVRSPAGTSPVPIKSAFDRRSKAQVSTKCPAECFIHLYTTCRP